MSGPRCWAIAGRQGARVVSNVFALGTRFGAALLVEDDVPDDTDEPNAVIANFAEAIRLYYPQLDDSRLQPAYTGIRPKISEAGQPAADFCIRGPSDHGDRPYVALYGIESPGLTASLAIAEHVVALLRNSIRVA